MKQHHIKKIFEIFRPILMKSGEKINVFTIIDREDDIRFYNYKSKTLQVGYFKGGIACKRKIRLKKTLLFVTGNSEHNFHVANVKGGEVFMSDGNRRNVSSSDYRLTDDTIRRMMRRTIDLQAGR